MAFEHEKRVRELIRLIDVENDHTKIKVLAAELEHLLSLENRPWPILYEKPKAS
jgi:hypothetical protein